jgi:immunity protein Imm1 of predicted polymorphic toxin system
MNASNGGPRQVTTVSGEDAQAVPVRTVEELDAELDRLDREAADDRPPMAEIVRPEGMSLTIGLGRDHSVVTYIASDAGPYFTSHSGDSSRDGTVAFYYGGHESEFMAEAAVPVEDAREAARLFFANGERPDNVDWRQD